MMAHIIVINYETGMIEDEMKCDGYRVQHYVDYFHVQYFENKYKVCVVQP